MKILLAEDERSLSNALVSIFKRNNYLVDAVYNGEDSFMKSDYLIVNKKVGTVTSLLGKSNNFSEQELEEIKKQDFVEKIGFFTPSAFDVAASFNLDGMAKF